jgi:hypothetical protein
MIIDVKESGITKFEAALTFGDMMPIPIKIRQLIQNLLGMTDGQTQVWSYL